jgi:DNA-binding MarR family transcriptional regulator
MKPMDGLALWREVTLGSVRSSDPDLTARQMAVLLTVYLTPPPHTVRGLAALLGVGKPVITRALDAMSAAGLVKRKRDEADKRNVLVQRTVKGSVFLNDLGERVSPAFGALR